MKVALRTVLVAALSLLVVGLPALPEGALRALQVDEQRISLAFAEGGGGAWVSAPVEGEHTIAGLTWDDPADAPEQAEVRIRVDGDWGDWEVVETDDEHTPDPGTPEEERARGGTAPIVIEGADAVQFRVIDDRAPRGLAADLVDVDDPDAARRVRDRPGAAEAAPSRPAIHPRSDWGGDSCPGPNREPIHYADQVQVLFVHHTAGHVNYSKSEVPSIIRGICSYHVNSNGWDDIGYNALVDRFGGIWEGRAGGIDKAVQGAHTGGFNNFSTGVVLIGNHDRTVSAGGSGGPTEAAEGALAAYAAWKLDVHNVDPLGSSYLVSSGNTKYGDGASAHLKNVSGHRDASYTACPGRYCYARLDPIRQDIDARGGFRIFGGWAQKLTMELRRDGTWEHPTIGFRFSAPAKWTFELRDQGGATVLRRTGSTSDPVYIEWDATIDGQPAPKGAYTTHVTARRISDGATASEATHVVELGGALGDFDDVPASNTFHDDIEWLALQRITLGCNPPTNTRYCPDDSVTRAQMAAFLDRALGFPEGKVGTFRDVPSDHTFAKPIADLARAGVTRGCNPPANDRFCPEQPVSRQEMAAFLVRALGLDAMDHPGFRDVPAGSTFANDIRRLATAEITMGCNPPTNDRYCPGNDVTRAEMAAFLRRGLRS